MNAKERKGQQGFTLIEVIAVLIILAVLAAVAIPRYMDLVDDARDQALNGAVAAGLSHVSLAYGQAALSLGREPTVAEVQSAASANNPESEDYSFAFAAAGDVITVTATELNQTPAKSASKDWSMP